ncbi:MAG: hypothetical protein R2710_26010 [Acidimicrobiales bacterium]
MVLGNPRPHPRRRPQAMMEWMWASFVDGAEWVMVPNVIGMALHADGGRMATKPCASGGAYLHRMSDFCRGAGSTRSSGSGRKPARTPPCTGDFLARNEDTLGANHRLARQFAGMRRLADLEQVREHAVEIRQQLDAGTL